MPLERIAGVEPAYSPWKGDVIPLYHIRVKSRGVAFLTCCAMERLAESMPYFKALPHLRPIDQPTTNRFPVVCRFIGHVRLPASSPIPAKACLPVGMAGIHPLNPPVKWLTIAFVFLIMWTPKWHFSNQPTFSTFKPSAAYNGQDGFLLGNLGLPGYFGSWFVSELSTSLVVTIHITHRLSIWTAFPAGF